MRIASYIPGGCSKALWLAASSDPTPVELSVYAQVRSYVPKLRRETTKTSGLSEVLASAS